MENEIDSTILQQLNTLLDNIDRLFEEKKLKRGFFTRLLLKRKMLKRKVLIDGMIDEKRKAEWETLRNLVSKVDNDFEKLYRYVEESSGNLVQSPIPQKPQTEQPASVKMSVNVNFERFVEDEITAGQNAGEKKVTLVTDSGEYTCLKRRWDKFGIDQSALTVGTPLRIDYKDYTHGSNKIRTLKWAYTIEKGEQTA